ncbi:hypothetical protein AB0M57_04850 [Streptomyces sp. NPDC051597]|uniref:hypothetical protein n=1 Tax=Streptomyces sp. NPDC051597 TaxID=3155049 RepID=UPI00343CFB2F
MKLMEAGKPSNIVPLFTRGAPHEDDARQHLIETLEAMHRQRGRTLTNEVAADSMHIAMDFIGLIFEGAQQGDVITSEQRATLMAFVEGGHAAADYWQR